MVLAAMVSLLVADGGLKAGRRGNRLLGSPSLHGRIAGRESPGTAPDLFAGEWCGASKRKGECDRRCWRLPYLSALHGRFSFIWFNDSKWARMPEEQRMTYLAGEFDSLAGFATGTASKQMAAHYNKCMKTSGMNLGQFSAHVAAFRASAS